MTTLLTETEYAREVRHPGMYREKKNVLDSATMVCKSGESLVLEAHLPKYSYVRVAIRGGE